MVAKPIAATLKPKRKRRRFIDTPFSRMDNTRLMSVQLAQLACSVNRENTFRLDLKKKQKELPEFP